MNKFKKIILGFVIICVLAFISLYAFVMSIGDSNPFNNREFDQTVWLSMDNDMNPDNPRGEMFSSLIEEHLKEGMTISQVKVLLGEPDIKDEKALLSYNLGVWSGMRIDYDSLDLVFSESGKLIKFYRVQH
jgi:hypothetical protein